MYGLPDYYGWNPTSLIGCIYILLFGIMFADVGQGFLLAVGGYLLYRTKKLDLAAIISRCGIASMLFGLVFGSVFGFEDLLDTGFTNRLASPSYRSRYLNPKPPIRFYTAWSPSDCHHPDHHDLKHPLGRCAKRMWKVLSFPTTAWQG